MNAKGQLAGSEPAVSILLPTYNGARYLAEQLDSIVKQTWTDFELLAIDDGSTDATPDILADYAARDDRIRFLPSAGNRGQKARLVELLHQSRGQWIAIADQDDIWALDKTERLVRAAGSAALAFGRSELIDADSKKLGRTLLDMLGAQRQEGERLSLLLRPQVSGHAMIVRREFVTADAFGSPHPFDWLISLVAEFSRGIVYDDDAVVFHRMHGSNSHNTNVLVRANLPLLRLHHLRDLITLVERRRLGLIEACRRLAASDLVPDDERRRFGEVGQLCASAWTTPRQERSAGELRASILAILKPMAGSDQDWTTVVDRLTVLTHGLLHPQTLVRLRRVL